LSGKDILNLFEVRTITRISRAINATFLALIPKCLKLVSFDEYKPIYFCNLIYKVISKVLSNIMKSILSSTLSTEEFGFLLRRLIHDAVGVA